MLKIERRKYIISYLKKHKNVSRKEMSKLLNVSLMTIGRDFKELEEEGYISSTHGGAYVKEFLSEEINYERKKNENLEIKKKIAKEAILEIKSGMTISLDAGTTTYELANLIYESDLENLTIITNDLYIAMRLYSKDSIKIHFIGGEISKQTATTRSSISIEQLKCYNFDLAFLGASSISKELYLTTPDEVKSIIKKNILKSSKRNILLVDHTKFYKKKLYNVLKLEEFDLIITDYNIKSRILQNKIKKVKGK